MVTGRLAVLAALVGCAEERREVSPLTALPDAQLLSRMSLDLRGVRPTQQEIEDLEVRELSSYLEEYLDDPALEDRMEDLFAETYRTRTDAGTVFVNSFGLDLGEQARLQRDAGTEPLRLVARVAASDLPIHEIVQADWSMANRVLGEVLDVDYPQGERGWHEVRYADGRPAAGVLSSTGLWWRYPSNGANANRQRANAISRILLCDDYLDREVDFDRSEGALDDDFEARTQTDPSCASCHSTLDPIASYLYGFTWYVFGADEVTRYHPSRERGWVDATGVEPGYYGEPGSTLRDLGRQIASDPRFEACLVTQLSDGLLGRDIDDGELMRHRNALRLGGQTMRPVLRSVVQSAAYTSAVDDGIASGAQPAKLASPAILASQVEALTGYVWESGGVELLTSDLLGYLTLAGGADGFTVTERAHEPTPTILLVQERLAEAAAEHAVRATLEQPGSVPWLDALDEAWRPDTDADRMEEALSTATLRALGRAATQAELADLMDLWEELYALQGDSPVLAWTGTLSVLLRDPDFLLY
ncbi:MAG: hypothetical protein KTR31_35430 [Myxococcales bacterium]|nr:hypothetical protein [Myxococcales bacterium]